MATYEVVLPESVWTLISIASCSFQPDCNMHVTESVLEPVSMEVPNKEVLKTRIYHFNRTEGQGLWGWSSGGAIITIDDSVKGISEEYQELGGAINPGNGGIDINIQDQTTPALITKFNQPQASTTLTAQATMFGYTINVASTTGMFLPTVTENGAFLILFDVGTGRFMVCSVISILGLVVTIDTQLDFEFPIGTIVDVCITNMAVNGSVTPQIFGIRGLGVVPGIDEQFDITRIIFTCITVNPVSLALFGDLPKLLRGLMLRHRDGTVRNIFNIKSNIELEGITLDWVPYDKSKPNQGQDGFSARLTFGGQAKVGVVQRIGPGEDLEMIIQDELTGIVLLEVIAEGHQVD